MLAKLEERNMAVELRKLGFSYREILAEVPVAKSTLSIWLHEVGLAKKQVQRITEKRILAALKGAQKRKQQRLLDMQEHLLSGKEKVGLLTERDIFIIGSMLYWAEGSKQKEHNVSQQVCFDNMDVRMVKIFLCWLDTICHIKTDSVKFQLIIHTSGDKEKALLHWSNNLQIKADNIHIYYKKHTVKTVRKNTGETYFGLMRVTVRKSTSLNRKINGWIHNIVLSFAEWCNGNTPAFGAARL